MDKRGESGFTLIELLVVIVILGILAAVVVFAVGGITDKGQTSADKADYQTIAHAEESYLAVNTTNGKYGTEAQLVGKFMHTASTLHDICLSPNRKAYEIVPQPPNTPDGTGCEDVSVPNP